MKKILSTLLPAFSLLTLGGCASTTGLSTTESDGVYYSSSDRTTQSVQAVAAATPATRDELTNPDYTDQGSSAGSASENAEYYDDDYAYSSRIRRFHQPYYRSFGYGYNDFIYADPFWYGGPAYYSAWGPGYGFGGYDPFWGGGYGYGYGSFVNINIGFGSPWGWGRPWGWNRWGGYGRGYYDGFYSGLYGGGYGGYYGGYGGGYYGGNNGYYGGTGGRVTNQRYGPRSSRSAEAVTSGRTGSGTVNGGGTSTGSGRGRVAEGGLVAPGGNTSGNMVGSSPASVPGRRNVRLTDAATNGSTNNTPGVRNTRISDLGTDGAAGQTAPDRNSAITRSPAMRDAATEQPTRSYEGRRWRVAQDGAGNTAQPQPSTDYSQPRRSNRSIFNQSQPQGSNGQAAEQPVRRASPQRTYEAPQRSAQRSYEAPQRSYEAPSRSSEPSRSYSPPSGGGGNGGGNSGGGGGRGRVN